MIKKLKSNKIISAFLIIMCIIVLFNPVLYGNVCLDAIAVWTFKILPLLFPMFVLTKAIVSICEPNNNIMEKAFSRLYNTPTGSFNLFFLSTLSGYPTGAKLIANMHNNGQASQVDCEKMLAFCSVSGPMFMLGTVGAIMLKSYTAGLIILISNILASLINGLLYRGKKHKIKQPIQVNKTQTNLSDIVCDSLVSILMVGAYVVLSFLVIQILKETHIIDLLSRFICSVFNINTSQDIVSSVLCGIFEITNGINALSICNTSLMIKIILSSSLIAFGGFSVFFQNLNFISKMKIPIKKLLRQKITQALICFIITLIICLIFL